MDTNNIFHFSRIDFGVDQEKKEPKKQMDQQQIQNLEDLCAFQEEILDGLEYDFDDNSFGVAFLTCGGSELHLNNTSNEIKEDILGTKIDQQMQKQTQPTNKKVDQQISSETKKTQKQMILLEKKKEIKIYQIKDKKGIVIRVNRKRSRSSRKSRNGKDTLSLHGQPMWVENSIGERVDLLAVMSKSDFKLLTEEQKKKRKLLKNRISAEESRLRARNKLGGLESKVEDLILKNKHLNKVVNKIQDEKEEMQKQIELLRSRLRQSNHKLKMCPYEPITKIKRKNNHPTMIEQFDHIPKPASTPGGQTGNKSINQLLKIKNTSELVSTVYNSSREIISNLTSINNKDQKRDLYYLDNKYQNDSEFCGLDSQRTSLSLFIILLIFGLFFQTNLLNQDSNNSSFNKNFIVHKDNTHAELTCSRTVLTVIKGIDNFDIDYIYNYDHDHDYDDNYGIIGNNFEKKDFPHFFDHHLLEGQYPLKFSRMGSNFTNRTNYEMCIEFNNKYLKKKQIWVS
ncbi:cyclic amp response element-binding protein a [Anaeramoeba flamelloides]|uniref:Cyclic amp response element-binding protein a n=1 Tax=Anaeramoeba flamelloides TaxID=1746091 RepID=A0AAV7YC29_9EUKA|nr:cyclic amp response element-binding protein a [Anaeramoeba flamelloides]